MQEPKLDLETLTWQLELLVDLEPEIVGRTLEELGRCLSAAEPQEQAGDIVSHFFRAGFIGLGYFLEAIERDFRKKDPVGTVLGEIFKSWAVFAPLSDEELFTSVAHTKSCSEFLSEVGADSGHRYSSQQGFLRLFDPVDLWRFGQNNTSNPERDYYNRRVTSQLVRSGPYRKHSFETDTLKRLSELRAKVPNFTAVTECVIDAVSLAVRCDKPIRITPILLVGEPGIGKSYYTDQLSECLGVPITRVAVDNLQIGAGIAGSSYMYSNSESGAVFKILTERSHLSPLVILDEIDKADNSFYGDPLNSLHNLLEPVSAKKFQDASIAVPIDASHVIWIATANYMEKIPPTIVSRFEVFEIPPQSRKTKEGILRGICREFKTEYPDMEFSNELLNALVDKTPREQRQLLQRALARAARLEESKVILEHLEQVAPGITPEPPKKFLGYL